MTDQLGELEQQLRDKERVVSALTERLEQAAEQLDRFRRTGADRGLRTSGGLPSELIENHEKLVEGMQNAVDQWEEAQAVTTLRRIEMRLEELQESFANGIPAVAMSGDSVEGSGDIAATLAEEEGGNSWKKLKDQLMGQESTAADDAAESQLTSTPISLGPAVEAEASPEVTAAADGSESVNDIEGPAEELPKIPAPEIIEAPQSINIAEASPGDLRKAVESRDDYIQNLIKRLRYSELMSGRFNGWKKLESAPEKLIEELEALDGRYNEQVRLAEVEMAIERAKVGREAARLQQVEMQLRQQLANGEQVVDTSGSKSKKDAEKANRRWSRFLGSQQRSQ